MHSKLLKAVSCGLVIALACASAQARVIFSDKFEQYSLEGFGTPQEGWAIVNSPIRSGNYAASSTLQPTPYPILVSPMAADNGGKSGASAGKGSFSVRGKGRDIDAKKFDGKKGDLQPGKFYTIRASMKVTGDTSGGIKVLVVHKRNNLTSDSSGRQPFTIFVQRNQWVVVVYGGKRWTLGQVDASRYTDWVVRIKLSNGQDGVVEVTKDGNGVVSYHGPNNAPDNPPGYVVYGAYSPRHSKKAEGDGRVTVYYDSVSISGG
jgi:hypothetical protein